MIQIANVLLWFVIICTLVTTQTRAQGGSQLLPSIGLNAYPDDTDSICEIPLRITNDFNSIGYQAGQPLHDFTLYDLGGSAVNLKQLLQGGKPLVLLTCSYSCPAFRERLPEFKNLSVLYADYLDFLLVYTVEAHPIDSVSPYYGYVNVMQQNLSEGILIAQAVTYGQRKQTAQQMVDALGIDVPLVIDGPCNEFWIASQCGPVTAYVIDTSGILYAKQGWFNQPGEPLGETLDQFLGIDLTTDIGCGASIVYDFSVADTIQYGAPGSVLYFQTNLVNEDDSLCAHVLISKEKELLPVGWSAAICLSICYSPSVKKVDAVVMPETNLPFILDLYTTPVIDTAFIRVGFKNIIKPWQQTSKWFIGITSQEAVATHAIEVKDLAVFPQPASHDLFVLSPLTPAAGATLVVVDIQGRVIHYQQWTQDVTKIDVAKWPNGWYGITAATPQSLLRRSFIVAR